MQACVYIIGVGGANCVNLQAHGMLQAISLQVDVMQHYDVLGMIRVLAPACAAYGRGLGCI